MPLDVNCATRAGSVLPAAPSSSSRCTRCSARRPRAAPRVRSRASRDSRHSKVFASNAQPSIASGLVPAMPREPPRKPSPRLVLEGVAHRRTRGTTAGATSSSSSGGPITCSGAITTSTSALTGSGGGNLVAQRRFRDVAGRPDSLTKLRRVRLSSPATRCTGPRTRSATSASGSVSGRCRREDLGLERRGRTAADRGDRRFAGPCCAPPRKNFCAATRMWLSSRNFSSGRAGAVTS